MSIDEPKLKKGMKKRSGQILILVLLVVVVALAVGLSVASRNITNLRTSTQTEQSQRAFSAAEGGVEDVLSRLSQIATSPNITAGVSEDVTVGGIVAKVEVKGSQIYQATIEEGTVGQIDLKGPPVASGNLVIEWAKNSQTVESSQPASIEVTQVYGTSPNYSQIRNAYSGGTFVGRDETGFTGGSCIYFNDEFKCRVTVAVAANPVVLRLRPFWVKTTVRVTSSGVLPLQTYDVTSTATTDLGITRRVQVTRTALPALPAAFDYVLFSEGSIVK